MAKTEQKEDQVKEKVEFSIPERWLTAVDMANEEMMEANAALHAATVRRDAAKRQCDKLAVKIAQEAGAGDDDIVSYDFTRGKVGYEKPK